MTVFRLSDHSRNGFTLVEMMIALLVFSMLAVAGVLLLRSAVDSNEVTDARLREMAGMQRLVSLMEADLSQAIARTYRDEDGDRKAAFIAESRISDEDFLTFTRGGQGNVNDEPRSSLQRVSYRLTEGQLERRQFEMTDGGLASDPARLVSGIENLEIRFRDRRGQWLSDWQPGRLNDMPRALELQFDQNGRTYRHVFLVGTGYL
ncbi:general secretion pathway protein J [Parasphingorhabdus marina DSM 22363]|uniref:Type II secretion system protein J n=1 Tax=Parasphingorhabdus marina DSM 22363 TaxID=1123272 RepID=A0A1N6GDW0_9SPHN|nr:type II secretion system minor pseudopilin GspJ [Parasphingorhabdus marina]SIO05725.1 general secretion pathway protein J [Parasphingorhabdus marina DSM 22363]